MDPEKIQVGQLHSFKSGARRVLAVRGWKSGRYVEWEPEVADGYYRQSPLSGFAKRTLGLQSPSPSSPDRGTE